MADTAGLKFHRFHITKCIFDRPVEFAAGKFKVDVNHQNEHHKENENLFRVVLTAIITAEDPSTPITFQVQAVGEFEIVGEVARAVRQNYFFVSGPSILYPYVRAFISTLSLQSGINPIIVPPVYFKIPEDQIDSNKPAADSNSDEPAGERLVDN
jgi:preprotein translocase subunit SecB